MCSYWRCGKYFITRHSESCLPDSLCAKYKLIMYRMCMYSMMVISWIFCTFLATDGDSNQEDSELD